MNNSAPVQKLVDISVRPLAPVIALKALPRMESKPKKRVSVRKFEAAEAQFYNKPIYRPKKYDLL
jgi:hypothetical protein